VCAHEATVPLCVLKNLNKDCATALSTQQRPTAAEASRLPMSTSYLLQPPAQQHLPRLGWPLQRGICQEKACTQQSSRSYALNIYSFKCAPNLAAVFKHSSGNSCNASDHLTSARKSDHQRRYAANAASNSLV
jgi:hypothetical protein